MAALTLALALTAGSWQTAEMAPWYGPGFYGNATACGQRYTRDIIGVAHRTAPCGKRIEVCYRQHCVRTRVIDRGPYPDPSLYAAMPLDLSARLNCWELAPGGRYQSPCPSRRDVRYRWLP